MYLQLKIITFVFLIPVLLFSQEKKMGISIGYFGETITYPGVVFGIENEKELYDKKSIVLKLDVGGYSHSRSNNGYFSEINLGFRRHFNNRIFVEEYLGIGTLAVFYNEEVWSVNENQNAERASHFGNWHLMPSASLGVGYELLTANKQFIWLRPKVFWQYPFNNYALPHFALQVGYTYFI